MTTPRNDKAPLVAYPAQKSYIEEKTLEFVFNIDDVSFTHSGTFYIRLSVHSLHTDDGSGLRVRTSSKAAYVPDFQMRTELIGPVQQDETISLTDKEHYFYLPAGYCKIDSNYDVYLQVEAYEINPDTAKGVLIGQNRFGIHPRSGSEITYTVEIGQPMYLLQGKFPILRTQEQDKLQKHCCMISYKAILREIEPFDEPVKKPPPKTKQPTKQHPQSQPPPPAVRQPPERKTPRDMLPPSEKRGPKEEIRGPRENASHVDDLKTLWPFLAESGFEEISLIIHGARNIFKSKIFNNSKPWNDSIPSTAYVIAKCKSDEDYDLMAQDATRVSDIPSSEPSWEEVMRVRTRDPLTPNEVLILTLVDEKTRQAIEEFRIPWQYLEPFHHYHLDLIMPRKEDANDVHLYVSLVRKQSRLPQKLETHPYSGLLLTLVNAEEQLLNPKGALIAVASIFSDAKIYGQAGPMFTRTLNLDFHPVTFPQPIKSLFRIPHFILQGQSQISYPGRPTTKPEWHFPFLFTETQELSTMFTNDVAIIVEFYSLHDMHNVMWSVENPVAYCCIPLNNETYHILSRHSQHAYRLTKPMNGYLKAANQKQLHANFLIQLFRERNVDPQAQWSQLLQAPSLTDSLNMEDDPSLFHEPAEKQKKLPQNSYHYDESVSCRPEVASLWIPKKESSPQTNWEPKVNKNVNSSLDRLDWMLQDEEGLPPDNAMETILPEYQYIFREPHQQKLPPPAKHTFSRQPILPGVPVNSSLPNGDVTIIHRAPNNIEYTDQNVRGNGFDEMERYRLAIRRMGADILALRDRLKEAEMENAELRRANLGHSNMDKTLIHSSELSGLSGEEIASRYATLQKKLSQTTDEVEKYRDKVQKLQNQIIRKNMDEEQYLKMGQAHVMQNSILQRMQEKMNKIKKLEDTVKQQEAIISKMEEQLERRGRPNRTPAAKKPSLPPVKEVSSPRDNWNNDSMTQALVEENRRLRRELETAKQSEASHKFANNALDDTERMELYQLLDKAEARIISLEKQLNENARKWGKDKEELLLKLTEKEHQIPNSLFPSNRLANGGFT